MSRKTYQSKEKPKDNAAKIALFGTLGAAIIAATAAVTGKVFDWKMHSLSAPPVVSRPTPQEKKEDKTGIQDISLQSKPTPSPTPYRRSTRDPVKRSVVPANSNRERVVAANANKARESLNANR